MMTIEQLQSVAREYVRTGDELRDHGHIGSDTHLSVAPSEFLDALAAHDEQVRAAAAQEAHNAAADVMTRRKIKPFDGLAVLAAIDGLSEERENG